MIRTLGIVLNTDSIGWSVVEGKYRDGKLFNNEILGSGVRIFTKAENPKNKESLALPRRNARSLRRGLARRGRRITRVKHLLCNFLNIDLEYLMQEHNELSTRVWELRSSALDRLLSPKELARIILYFAKHRGYNDIAYKIEGEDTETGKIKKAIQNNTQKLQDSSYQTIGNMFYHLYEKNKEKVRNSDGYDRCVGRALIKQELEIIFEKQKSFGSTFITQDFVKTLLGDEDGKNKLEREGVIFYDRPLKGFGDLVGDCQHIVRGNGENPKRAYKQSPSAEEFIAISKIINTLMNIKNTHGIVDFDIKGIIEASLKEALKTKKGLTYKAFRKIANIPDKIEFYNLDYGKENPENQAFFSLQTTKVLTSVLPSTPISVLDQVVGAFGNDKEWDAICVSLKKCGLDDSQIEKLKKEKINISKTINLSLEALYHILPLMREGVRYDLAVAQLEEQGIFSKKINKRNNRLPALCDLAKDDSYFNITNPLVNRSLCELRKVVNALLDKYEGFHYFNISLDRNLIDTKEQRNERWRREQKEKRLREEVDRVMGENEIEINRINQLAVKLWIQQKGRCIYSGAEIPLEKIASKDGVLIDYIVPPKRNLDRSEGNQVLCLTSSLLGKDELTPYEWLGSDEERWKAFINNIYKTDFSLSKKRKIVSKKTKSKTDKDYLDFSLSSDSYAKKVVKEYIKQNISFLPLPFDKKEHIRVISTPTLMSLKRYWGAWETNKECEIYQAKNAIIVAFIQNSSIQAFAEHIRNKDTDMLETHIGAKKIRESDWLIKKRMRWPMENFLEKIDENIKKAGVSYAVSHKVTGELHKAIVRRRQEYYKEYGGDAGVDIALKNGKIRQVRGGIVDNGRIVRTDFFRHKESGHYKGIPIYTIDVARGILPNKLVVAGKDKNGVIRNWEELNDDFEFCFSLFRNDGIRVKTKDMKEPIIVIYKGFSNFSGSMTIQPLNKIHCNVDEKMTFKVKEGEIPDETTLGVMRLKMFEKVKISVLGDICNSKPQKRQKIRLKSSPKRS